MHVTFELYGHFRCFISDCPNLSHCAVYIWLVTWVASAGAGKMVPHHLVHYCADIMGAIASQITSLMIVYSIVNSGANQRKHQSSASLAFVRGIQWWPVNSPHKWPVTRKMFPFDEVIMQATHVKTRNHKISSIFKWVDKIGSRNE